MNAPCKACGNPTPEVGALSLRFGLVCNKKCLADYNRGVRAQEKGEL